MKPLYVRVGQDGTGITQTAPQGRDHFIRDALARATQAEQPSQKFTVFLMWLRQLIKQCLSLFQIERVEAFGEPAVDRGE